MAEQSMPVVVSVAMPIYNAGKHLRLAVLSIVAQTFQRWELFIIDDGSTDNALESISDIRDARIRIFRDGSNKGLAARLNQACRMASGRYLARMDQDDVSFPERFECQVRALNDLPGVDLVATRAITIDEDGVLTGRFPSALSHEEICAAPWRGFVFPHPTWMGRVEWFLQHRYAEPAPYLCEDQELLLRSYRESHFLTLDHVLFAYRVRRKPDWRKLAKTRRAVLAVQVRFFLAYGHWGQLLFAGCAYVAKSGMDLARRLRRPLTACRAGDDEALLREWDATLERLQDVKS